LEAINETVGRIESLDNVINTTLAQVLSIVESLNLSVNKNIFINVTNTTVVVNTTNTTVSILTTNTTVVVNVTNTTVAVNTTIVSVQNITQIENVTNVTVVVNTTSTTVVVNTTASNLTVSDIVQGVLGADVTETVVSGVVQTAQPSLLGGVAFAATDNPVVTMCAANSTLVSTVNIIRTVNGVPYTIQSNSTQFCQYGCDDGQVPNRCFESPNQTTLWIFGLLVLVIVVSASLLIKIKRR
jgi:hypothetical protein